MQRIKQPDFPYKTTCDWCTKAGVKHNKKRDLFSWWDEKRKVYRGACQKHLKLLHKKANG